MTRKRHDQFKTLRPGIILDGDGIRVRVAVGSGPRKRTAETRYALDRPRKEIIAEALIWQDETRAELRKDYVPPPATATLGADVPRFLETVPSAQRPNFEDDLNAWLREPVDRADPTGPTYRDVLRDDITRVDVRKVVALWQDDGFAASTINHRVHALKRLYADLDDDEDAYNPAEKIKRIKGKRNEKRAIDFDIIDRIIAAIPDHGRPTKGQSKKAGTFPTVNLTKIRLAVMANAGLPHQTLKRLRRRDVDLRGLRLGEHGPGPHIYVPPRQKGAGAAAEWLPLMPRAVAAFERFDTANLWEQKFSNSAMWKAWTKAIKRVAAACKTEDERERFLASLPSNCRPYDVRHSFATEVSAVTGSDDAANMLLQHSPREGRNAMTARYTHGARGAIMRTAIARVAQRWETPPPAKKKTTLRGLRGGKR